MALKKDKEKVLGEVFDDERVKSFLNVEKIEGVNHDFDILEKAYRGMKAENFETFLQFFNDAGNDINAANKDNQSLLQIVSQHKHSNDYVTALKNAGAKY